MAADTDLNGMAPLQLVVPSGVSNAVYIQDPAFTNSGVIQYISGGSLLIMRAPGQDGPQGGYGATVSGASLVAAWTAGEYWRLDTAPLAYNGCARYYLAAVGATVTCQILRSLSTGYQN